MKTLILAILAINLTIGSSTWTAVRAQNYDVKIGAVVANRSNPRNFIRIKGGIVGGYKDVLPGRTVEVVLLPNSSQRRSAYLNYQINGVGRLYRINLKRGTDLLKVFGDRYSPIVVFHCYRLPSMNMHLAKQIGTDQLCCDTRNDIIVHGLFGPVRVKYMVNGRRANPVKIRIPSRRFKWECRGKVMWAYAPRGTDFLYVDRTFKPKVIGIPCDAIRYRYFDNQLGLSSSH